jgi:hypothetical protein
VPCISSGTHPKFAGAAGNLQSMPSEVLYRRYSWQQATHGLDIVSLTVACAARATRAARPATRPPSHKTSTTIMPVHDMALSEPPPLRQVFSWPCALANTLCSLSRLVSTLARGRCVTSDRWHVAMSEPSVCRCHLCIYGCMCHNLTSSAALLRPKNRCETTTISASVCEWVEPCHAARCESRGNDNECPARPLCSVYVYTSCSSTYI